MPLESQFLGYFKLGFTPSKAEDELQSMKLHEHEKEKHEK